VSQGLLGAITDALRMAFMMGWVILWALVLGFALSAVVQAVVTKGEMSRLLPDSRPRAILLASALGAASSSCSYAAVVLTGKGYPSWSALCEDHNLRDVCWRLHATSKLGCRAGQAWHLHRFDRKDSRSTEPWRQCHRASSSLCIRRPGR